MSPLLDCPNRKGGRLARPNPFTNVTQNKKLFLWSSGIKSVNQPLITEAYSYSDKYKIVDFGMLSDEFI